mgnify:CR=1 FL=1
MDIIKGYISEIMGRFVFPNVDVTDAIEILVLAVIIYHIAIWIRNTRAWMLLKGIALLGLVALVAAIFQLNVILWLFEKTIGVGVTLLVVVFQPELRHALEQLGQKKIINTFNFFDDPKDKMERFSDKTIDCIIKAVCNMAKAKTGALIVIEKDVVLSEYERGGISLDSNISSELLMNIFEHNTPLHDGAVLIRGNRIVSATCYLPLSDNLYLSKELGTRHRAGVGISEVSDSLTIIVSEETGKVSIAVGGKITRNINADSLRKRLKNLQNRTDDNKKIKSLKGWHRNETKNNA